MSCLVSLDGLFGWWAICSCWGPLLGRDPTMFSFAFILVSLSVPSGFVFSLAPLRAAATRAGCAVGSGSSPLEWSGLQCPAAVRHDDHVARALSAGESSKPGRRQKAAAAAAPDRQLPSLSNSPTPQPPTSTSRALPQPGRPGAATALGFAAPAVSTAPLGHDRPRHPHAHLIN